ncbi:MAG TPA: CGNR zinc finger domain-containing protein [Gemmatimonadales bacterium]|jgi:predicted RNA-binding Zn ribbon-like protein
MPDPEFLLLGDALWLEFVNTAATPPNGRDSLPNPAAWLRWTTALRVEPPTVRADFQNAVRFRTLLLSLARALDIRRAPPPAAIEAINTRLLTLEGKEQLVRIGGAWHLRFAPGRPPSALEALARSAAQTLANPLESVRRCANPECGLYFADASPSLSRRWCSRSRCGERGRIERRRGARPIPLLAEG